MSLGVGGREGAGSSEILDISLWESCCDSLIAVWLEEIERVVPLLEAVVFDEWDEDLSDDGRWMWRGRIF